MFVITIAHTPGQGAQVSLPHPHLPTLHPRPAQSPQNANGGWGFGWEHEIWGLVMGAGGVWGGGVGGGPACGDGGAWLWGWGGGVVDGRGHAHTRGRQRVCGDAVKGNAFACPRVRLLGRAVPVGVLSSLPSPAKPYTTSPTFASPIIRALVLQQPTPALHACPHRLRPGATLPAPRIPYIAPLPPLPPRSALHQHPPQLPCPHHHPRRHSHPNPTAARNCASTQMRKQTATQTQEGGGTLGRSHAGARARQDSAR